MTSAPAPVPHTVTVRYWASARAAAGVPEEQLDWTSPAPLSQLLERLGAVHGPELARVVGACSVLVGERRGSAETDVRPGDTVELLPPFAGG